MSKIKKSSRQLTTKLTSIKKSRSTKNVNAQLCNMHTSKFNLPFFLKKKNSLPRIQPDSQEED
jgi:hypothetical protein